ncbi:MAG: glycosyltransferase family 4 protein [Candidatus Paceibacterota bacterium]|jgi:glycosyltransferase involved in cell wall biosynthesis
MKKKILFVITKSNFGGAQKYVYDLATSLPKEHFEVAVVTGGSGPLIQKLAEKNIRVIHTASLTRDINITNDVKSLIELFSIFRKEKPAVVHLNSAKASGVGAFVARLAGVPNIIFTAHGWAFNEERPHWQRIAIKFFSWLTVIFAHKTIAVSEAMKKNTEGWPIVNNKIVVIKNGIAKPNFYTKEEALRMLFEKAGIQKIPNSLIVGTIAEFHNNKGLQYSIEAFAKLIPENPSLFYFILGSGEKRGELTELIKKLNIYKNVFLLEVPKDAAEFMRAFDIFILPSITEGLALVLLEAGFAELPVVASRVGGIPEIVEDEVTGILVPARAPDAIANSLKLLIGSPALRAKLGQSLGRKVSSDFGQETMVSKTKLLYEKK